LVRKALLCPSPRPHAERGTEVMVVEQWAERSGKGLGVAGRYDGPIVLSKDVDNAGGVRGDDGQAAGHRLDRRHGKTLVARGEGIDVRGREMAADHLAVVQ